MRPGWDVARRIGGYGAAGTLTLYLLVKVIWIAASLFGDVPQDFGTAEWVTLNATTIVMAGAGVTVGLALAQPWGRRAPAPAVLFFAWLATGFLVPMLPYMVARLILAACGVAASAPETAQQAGSTTIPAWQTAMLTLGFGGMALGVAVALPIYLRQRWPASFVGNAADHRPIAARLRTPAGRPLVRATVLLIAALAAARSYEAVVGPLAGGAGPDLNGRLLMGNTAVWLLAAGWVVRQLTVSGRAPVPLWLPTALGFAASGFLVAWNGWLLFVDLLQPTGYTPGEPVPIAVVEHLFTALAGVAVIGLVLPAKTTQRPAAAVASG